MKVCFRRRGSPVERGLDRRLSPVTTSTRPPVQRRRSSGRVTWQQQSRLAPHAAPPVTGIGLEVDGTSA